MLSIARGAHGGSTAEWALATLLAVYRDLIPFERDRVTRTWDRRPTETLLDKQVLVIGAGDLGTQLKRRLDACDAHTTLVGVRRPRRRARHRRAAVTCSARTTRWC